MDNGFKDRVDKVFGSISSSWSLTDAKVERREWKRDNSHRRNDDETPVSSSFNHLFNNNNCSTTQDDIDFDIRSSIGLDSTLDHEEEEDAYDKMAQGRENDADDCVFVKDVTHYGPYLNSHNVVKNHPFSNHHDASLITRLKEEEEDDDDEPMLNAQPPCFTVPPPNDGISRTKSILKRKSDEVPKPAKRVRFDPTCKNQDDELTNAPQLPQVSKNGSSVPDYILNPSKYTRYNLDDLSHLVKEVSNSGASLEQKSSGELPRSLVFIPRKKKADNNEGQQVKQSSTQAASSIGIAAQQGETSEIHEDDLVCTKARRFQKPDRRYRSKMEEDDNVC